MIHSCDVQIPSPDFASIFFLFIYHKLSFYLNQIFLLRQRIKPSIECFTHFVPLELIKKCYLHIFCLFYPIKLIRAHFKDIRFKMTASVLFVSPVLLAISPLDSFSPLKRNGYQNKNQQNTILISNNYHFLYAD